MSIETLKYIADSPPEEYGGFREDVVAVAKWALLQIERLSQWVNDLQSGMYVNCVYCGHRYGPREDTPVAMADVLRDHIEQCPKHPLSAAKAELEQLRRLVDYLDDPQVLLEIPQPHRMRLSQLLHGSDHRYEPFTTRDGSQACRHCHGVQSMHAAGERLRWEYVGEGEWSAASAMHDGGCHFEWRISVYEDGRFGIANSDSELTQETRGCFATFAEACNYCESAEQRNP